MSFEILTYALLPNSQLHPFPMGKQEIMVEKRSLACDRQSTIVNHSDSTTNPTAEIQFAPNTRARSTVNLRNYDGGMGPTVLD